MSDWSDWIGEIYVLGNDVFFGNGSTFNGATSTSKFKRSTFNSNAKMTCGGNGRKRPSADLVRMFV